MNIIALVLNSIREQPPSSPSIHNSPDMTYLSQEQDMDIDMTWSYHTQDKTPVKEGEQEEEEDGNISMDYSSTGFSLSKSMSSCQPVNGNRLCALQRLFGNS